MADTIQKTNKPKDAKTDNLDKKEEKDFEDMTADEISEAILDAIEIIAANKVDKAKFDKTVTGKIKGYVTEKDNANDHRTLYNITLDTGGDIQAYDTNEWFCYPIGTTVQIKMPSNDADQIKTIVKVDSTTVQMKATFIPHAEGSDYHTIIETYPNGATLKYLIRVTEVPDDPSDPSGDTHEECIQLIRPDGSVIDLEGFDF